MPKRTDLKKIMLIGSGPIVIGQACEFDYSGTQACKALKEEGYEVVLINSNPATIMTDPDLADHTYVEPITIESLEKIIAKERPDALLPTLGGQTGLNVAVDGVLMFLDDDEHLLTDEYRWYSTPIFTPSNSGTVELYARDVKSTGVDDNYVYLDDTMFVNMSSTSPVRQTNRQNLTRNPRLSAHPLPGRIPTRPLHL